MPLLVLLLAVSAGTAEAADSSEGLFLFDSDIRDVSAEQWLEEVAVVYRTTESFVGVASLSLAADLTGTELLAEGPFELEDFVLVSLRSEDGIDAASALGSIILATQDALIIRLDGAMPEFFVHEAILMVQPLRVFREPAAIPFRPGPEADGDIEDIVASVSEDSVKAFIQQLEDYGTRFCITDQFHDSAVWVESRLESYWVPAEVQEFQFRFYGNTYTSWNVIGEKPGQEDPDVIYIVCGHLDSISPEYMMNAPGADDNASGSATVLEAARVLQYYDFKYTIRFLCFGAEELGLIGAEYYVEQAYQAGDNIQGVINLDMLLYAPVGEDTLYCPYDDQSQEFAMVVDSLMACYVPELGTEFAYDPGAVYSDHAAFWQFGYPAILGIERDIDNNPHYHQTTDLLENYLEYFPFGTNCVKGAIAALAALAEPLGPSGVEGEDPQPGPFTISALHPNPASASATLELVGTTGPVSVSVYDIAGRLAGEPQVITYEGTGSLQIALDTVPEGLYIVRASAGESTSTAKLVVAR